jgi:hypothetical protein
MLHFLGGYFSRYIVSSDSIVVENPRLRTAVAAVDGG